MTIETARDNNRAGSADGWNGVRHNDVRLATSYMTSISTDPIVQVLERYWGFREFRTWQREAIDTILERRDSVLVRPTGGGKSLCFQAPALVDDGTAGPRLALVVSPLIALMKDQVDGLVASGVPAACL